MPSAPVLGCDFCDLDGFRRSEVCVENPYALYASSGFRSPQGVLPGSGVIVPLTHRESPFALTRDEWTATRDLLIAAKQLVDARWHPDGYTVGWNCGVAGVRRCSTLTFTSFLDLLTSPTPDWTPVGHKATGQPQRQPGRCGPRTCGVSCRAVIAPFALSRHLIRDAPPSCPSNDL
jgi:hypothetical protein